MSRLYPIDAFICTGEDYSRNDHDHGTIICHACFDAQFPWTAEWDGHHKRVNAHQMEIRPGGDLVYTMANTYNFEDTIPTFCDACHRIIFYAYCTKGDSDEDQPCECDTCLPELYAEDYAKVESGEYDAYRARVTARPDRREEARGQRERARQSRARYQGYGWTVPEWCQPRQPHTA